MHRYAAYVMAGLLLAAPAQAGEFRAGVGGWRYTVSGTVEQDGDTLDFQDDLSVEASGRRSFALEYDTGRGPWPDLAAGFTPIRVHGSQEQAGGPFGPITIAPGSVVLTDADFDDTELTLRYPFAWRRLEAALGVTGRWLRGEIRIHDTDSGDQVRQPYDVVFPQLHAQLRYPLGRVLTLVLAGHGAEYSGDRASEWRVAAELELLKPLRVEFGRLEKRYQIETGAGALDARLEGTLVRIGVEIPR